MRIELLKPHTHAGIHYVPGDIVAMDEVPARWLIDTGVAKPAPVAKPQSLNKPEEASK
jgi:hypothetical protein